MKLHDLGDEKDIQAVSERMWEIVQRHKPALKKVTDAIAADKRLGKNDILHAGFVMGAAYALAEMMQGNIREANRG